MTVFIAQGPEANQKYEKFIIAGGAEVGASVADSTALIWHDYSAPLELLQTLEANPQIAWVQLPFAGVDNFAAVLKWIAENRSGLIVTSAKGAYSEPVAEHALMLALALGRAIPERVRAKTWGDKFAKSLFDAEILIIGGGGITAELIRLLNPFRPRITVIRRNPASMSSVETVASSEELHQYLPNADFVFVCAALTDETRGMFNKQTFALMKPSAYFVNIARGGLVVTDDLIWALNQKIIAGAGVDVTDPEPLPESNALWDAPNIIITPHTADTPQMIYRMFGERIRQNVSAFVASEQPIGRVDLKLGY